jgi:GR25 family glycosyltransferase involved in LPS biosynthesis/glycosyltransferase involved in cell wall biosynthesis
MSNATVCLNMIVKNEAHLIRQTLEMLCSKIRFDYWVICDTGSTDATREIIQDFFGNRVHIPGELHCDEWVNFGHNRTKALTYAHNKTDLLLVFDADDTICGTIQLPTAVTHDEYHLKFGAPNTGDSTYTRTQLINNRKRFRYYSVLHEYISCLEPSPDEGRRVCVLEGDYYVVSGRSGARNRDPDKYLKDALLLEAAHAEALAAGDDLHMRYAFYCANSYRDCGRYEDAIRWYKTTLSQDNWVQEKYLACIYAHDCYTALGQKEHGFFYLVKSLSYDLERAEGVYALIQHYCSCSTPPASDNVNFQIAYNYYRIVQPHYERAQLEVEPQFKLFVQPDKANFFLPYYMIIVADRVGDRACGIRMYEIIFRKKQRMVGQWYLRNLFYNVRCFVEHIRKDTLGVFAALANDYLRFLRENGVPLSIFDEVASTYDYGAYGIELSSQPLLQPQTFSRAACRSSPAILFYTGYSSVPWNYSGMTRGALGGSEKAVAYLSLELLKLGYTVYVSGDVQPEEIALANNTQCSLKYVALPDLPELLRTTAFHTIVCSRYVSFLELYGATASWYQFYIWAHDTHLLPYGCALSDTAIVEKWSARIDGCVCQTRWHADEYARKYPALQSKIRVINNGIDAALFPAIGSLGSLGKKVRNRFIYTSRTERGLSRILELWPDILKMMPDATLVISTYVAFPCNDDERRIQARIAELNQINNGDGVQCIRHLGQLNPAQLYAEMGAAEYWLYPTDWPETSCITAMEMLMSGVICLYYPVAGLTDTMGGCGIQVAPGSEVETLCRITSDETQKTKQREQGRAYAEGCTWPHRAQQWVQTLNPTNTLQTPHTSPPAYKTMIINLKRRSDRKVMMESRLQAQTITEYEFVDAVDGSQLLPTAYIQRLFHGNNFNYRKGVIGCAMSHLALWQRLMHDTSCDVYVVIEDDAELVDNFELKLQKAVQLFMSDPRAELCYISGFSITDPCTNASNLQLIKKDNNHDMGTGGYLIKKSGAVRFVDYYDTHSMKASIDASIIIDFNEHLYKINQHLIKSPFFGPDTDIQQSYDEISFSQMNSNYRLGDIIIQDADIGLDICSEHSNTIGSDYILSHDKSNRIALATQIVLRHIQKYEHLFPQDIEDSTVVHLRLGDAVGGTHFYERRLRPFEPSWYQSIIPDISQGSVYVIGKCHFGYQCSANYDECNELSKSYMENVLSLLKATHFDGGHPDIDLCFAVKAKLFVQGRGCYSKLIVEVRRCIGLKSIETPSHDFSDLYETDKNKIITVAFCDWWEIEYGGGTFNLHDNFFVNLIKTHVDSDVVVTTVSPSQNPDVLFYSVFGQSNGAYRAGRKVFYAGEPVSHRADADFNITFDSSNAINTRLPLWVCYFDHAILTPNRFPPITKREKFCSYIATNPRANRETFVEQLSSQYKRVDCGGKHLNNIGGAIPPGTNASGKIEHNKQYKFAIAFENTQYPGYVTEKICDVYKSGCIPIYWGTPDIIKDFNPSTFINANDFPNFDALIDHIRRVDCDDALYASYFKDPVLSDEWMQIFADPNHTFFKQIVSDILHI